ncbi:MAG: phosphoglucosamine mutase, partial [Rhodothermales bacterium]|nr:phosphoglucosamine mutase [Rhodothermales bacterium]
PRYVTAKKKVPLGDLDARAALDALAERHREADVSTVDGVKIDLKDGWVHVRPSNTEPILRVYAEARTREDAEALAEQFMDEITAEA